MDTQGHKWTENRRILPSDIYSQPNMNIKIINSIIQQVQRHNENIFRFTVLFFLITGFIYSYWKGCNLNFPDERQYYAIAVNLASGAGFSLDGIGPTALFPPIYPIFMAICIKAGASIPMLRFANFIFLACSLGVTRSILRHQRAEAGLGISAILMAGYCVIFYTAGTLYPQTLFTLVLLLLLRVTLEKNRSITSTVAFGVLCGLLMLIHSTGVFIPPIVGLWIIFSSQDRKKAVWKVTASALVALACISIWATRNYKVFNRFIPLTTHGGDTLYIGNNPHTSLSAWYDYINDDYYQEASSLPETEQNPYYLKKTMEFWTTQPATAVKLYLRKLAEYFNYYNNLFINSEFGAAQKIIMFITYYPLLICLAVRLLFMKKIPLSPAEKLFVIIYIASAFFHALFIPRIRFRLPYDALLITYIGIMYSIIIYRKDVNSIGNDTTDLL